MICIELPRFGIADNKNNIILTRTRNNIKSPNSQQTFLWLFDFVERGQRHVDQTVVHIPLVVANDSSYILHFELTHILVFTWLCNIICAQFVRPNKWRSIFRNSRKQPDRARTERWGGVLCFFSFYQCLNKRNLSEHLITSRSNPLSQHPKSGQTLTTVACASNRIMSTRLQFAIILDFCLKTDIIVKLDSYNISNYDFAMGLMTI